MGLKERIERIEKRLEKIEENINILMNPFSGKSSGIFENLDMQNILRAMVSPDSNVALTKTNVEKLKSSSLTDLEKKVLLLLYEEEKGLSIPQLAEKLHCTAQPVFEAINSLTEKGASFVSKKMKDFYVFRLDERLKEAQAKENFIEERV